MPNRAVPISQTTKMTPEYEHPNPLPPLQLAISILIQAAEGLSATVIFPFVPQFVQDTGITGGDERKTGYWAGVLESVFFVAEFFSVYIWGRAADSFGRRPVLLLGPLGLAVSLVGFGWSKTFLGLLFWRSAQGVFNGNIGKSKIPSWDRLTSTTGVVKTVLVEISDKTNLAQAMSFVPVAWTSGTTLGPIIGGLLSEPAIRFPESFGKLKTFRDYPYLLPCAVVGLASLSIFVLGFFGLKETLPTIRARSNQNREQTQDETEPLIAHESPAATAASYSSVESSAVAKNDEPPSLWELLVPDLVVPLVNYGSFCFVQTSYQVLFPLMYSTSIENGGLGFSPYQIGVIRGIWGFLNTLFQIFLAARLIKYLGPRTTYICSFANFAVCIGSYPLLSFLAMRAGRVDLFVWLVVVAQLTANLLVGVSYASIQLFIVRSVPRASAISVTNSIAQMVSTILRALAPFLASALFAVSIEKNLIGGFLVYIVLLAIVFVGIWASLLLKE
ncbi:unnamed protein product [Mycena citricolor]|uniref:Major facilitator superfamily (MFS) profile domain-containing protein n=1 Tax=Mycena citricolor TaxID=2018698 RepID=A0AAD2HAI4_9AGAR|nr:unnamed protein product [Mycena citricolor]